MASQFDEYTPGDAGGSLAVALSPAAAKAEGQRNERAAHEARVARNRARKIPEPQPGAKLYVSTARGIKARRRAGIDFTATERTPVECVVGSDEEVAKRVLGGEAVVNEVGAHLILADDSLLVHSTPAPVAAQTDEMAAELEATKAELAAMKAERARGRAATPRGGDGRPERLAPATDTGHPGHPDLAKG